MSSHEARINDALKSLGEEFRLGMVAIEEYRKRRRLLLESWNERDATTSPRAVRSTTTMPTPVAPESKAVTAISPAPPKKGSGPVLVVIIAAGLIAGGGWFAYSQRRPHSMPEAAALPSAAPASAAVVAIKKAADDFLARNRWDPEPIEEFLAQWQSVPAPDRARALEEPSLRTLRHEAEQNLQAESQLVAADAPAAQRRRLDALSRFARELGN